MRIRVRTLMIVVAVAALLMAAIGPGRAWYHRWSYHRAQSAWFAKFEQKERKNAARESAEADDREAIRSRLTKQQGFAGKSPREIDQAVGRVVEYHKQRASESLGAARQWELKRRDSETAALWCWDPFAPDVP